MEASGGNPVSPPPPLPPPATWRRKTQAEQQCDLRAARWARFNPAGAILMGVIAGLVGAVIGLFRSFQRGFESAEIAIALVVSLGFAVLVGASSYLLQVLGWLSQPRRVRMGICDRCFRLTLDGTLERCECGGTYEDVDDWKLNRCPKCGYDLRGSDDRCPECGASVALDATIPDQCNQDREERVRRCDTTLISPTSRSLRP